MVTGGGAAAVDVLSDALAAVESDGTVAEEVAACELLSRALIEIGRLDEATEIARSPIERVDPADHDTMARAAGRVRHSPDPPLRPGRAVPTSAAAR